ncbi:hypothetical protein MRX96_005867 [Rhipicephalus microplus]
MHAAARRAADAAAGGDTTGTALEPPAVPGPAPENQERNGAEVELRRGNWYLNERLQTILSATAVLCSVALVVYLSSTISIRIEYRDILHASKRKIYADHADLPLFSGCDEMACQQYMAAIITSINKSQDPCKNFYGLDVEACARCGRAGFPRWPEAGPKLFVHGECRKEGSRPGKVRMINLQDHLQNSLQDLKRFMAEHDQPWPEKSPLGPISDSSPPLWKLEHSLVDPSQQRLCVHGSLPCGYSSAIQRGRRDRSTTKSTFEECCASSDVLAPRSADIISTIEAINKLILDTLAPAMTAPEPSIVRMSNCDLTETAILPFPTGRLVLLFNEYLMWARRFSSYDVVEVANVGLLRSVVYILGLGVETQQALTLSLGLRVAHELGWMAHREIADVTLEIAGLPRSAHACRCLFEIENAVGTGWLSLITLHLEYDSFIRDVRSVLNDAVVRRSNVFVQLRAHSLDIQWNGDSFLAGVLPEASRRARFCIDWLNLMAGRWRLQEQDITNVLKPGSLQSQRWSFHGTLTIAEDYYVFPLYRSDLPLAVNYGGAGRLIVDEMLRGLFHELMYNQSRSRSHVGHIRLSNDTVLSDWPPYHVDIKAVLAALDRSVDLLYGDPRRRCNKPVKELPEFAAAFRCNLPHTQS